MDRGQSVHICSCSMMTSLVSSAVAVSFHCTFQKSLINQTEWAVENMSHPSVALVAILELFLPCVY